MNKALEHHAEWIESYLRTTGGGANPSSVAINSTIVVASLLSEIVEQNNKIIELLSNSPFKDEEVKREKPKETKFVKQAVLLNQLFKNGEEISDKTILKYLQDNNDSPDSCTKTKGIRAKKAMHSVRQSRIP